MRHRIHIYPQTTYRGKRRQSSHHTGRIADCWCEPIIREDGPDVLYLHSTTQDWRRRPRRQAACA